MTRELIRPGTLPRLRPDDRLADGTVLDFWAWAMSDLRMNNARGHLAEYLVARAVRDERPGRVEWDGFDVLGAEGTRIEVKSTGRLQSWASPALSSVRWTFGSVTAATAWDEARGAMTPVDPRDRVDVWVFALQTQTDPDAYDPLAVDHWEFRVVPHRALLVCGQRSGGPALLERCGALLTGYEGLAESVAAAHSRNDTL